MDTLFHRVYPKSKVPFLRTCDKEIVLNEKFIRYGQVGAPDKQTKYLKEDILCFMVDDENVDICIDIGKWRSPVFAADCLTNKNDIEEFIEAIKKHWQSTQVFSRVEYQNYVKNTRENELKKKKPNHPLPVLTRNSIIE